MHLDLVGSLAQSQAEKAEARQWDGLCVLGGSACAEPAQLLTRKANMCCSSGCVADFGLAEQGFHRFGLVLAAP
ncbi:hypothetical protein MCAG_05210 [Micromonospora sp. ATCC 39149]|nr:hypothetical protein MCAG_05210 [Micromonospora sp. ATCC 39149]